MQILTTNQSIMQKIKNLSILLCLCGFIYSCGPKRLGCGPGRCYAPEKIKADHTPEMLVSILDIENI